MKKIFLLDVDVTTYTYNSGVLYLSYHNPPIIMHLLWSFTTSVSIPDNTTTTEIELCLNLLHCCIHSWVATYVFILYTFHLYLQYPHHHHWNCTHSTTVYNIVTMFLPLYPHPHHFQHLNIPPKTTTAIIIFPIVYWHQPNHLRHNQNSNYIYTPKPPLPY